MGFKVGMLPHASVESAPSKPLRRSSPSLLGCQESSGHRTHTNQQGHKYLTFKPRTGHGATFLMQPSGNQSL
eukprot:647173-Amphidinium_carterae.1